MADVSSIIHQISIANVPAILTPTTGDTILASNPARGAFLVQNLGTNPLYVRLGAGATTGIFHAILKGSSSQDDGTGGSYAMEAGTVYTGDVSVAGTSPRLVVIELE